MIELTLSVTVSLDGESPDDRAWSELRSKRLFSFPPRVGDVILLEEESGADTVVEQVWHHPNGEAIIYLKPWDVTASATSAGLYAIVVQEYLDFGFKLHGQSRSNPEFLAQKN